MPALIFSTSLFRWTYAQGHLLQGWGWFSQTAICGITAQLTMKVQIPRLLPA